MVKPSITAIVLAQDEGLHIRRCIASLAPAVERICVVDSGSKDETVALARSLGADVFTNAWINHATQFNWALDHCGIESKWVLRLDADEYLEPELQGELIERLPSLPPDLHGVLLKRKYFFLRRWIRHGGMHPLFHLRLWRTGSARIEQRWMDEHAVLNSGLTIRFEGAFVDDNLRDLAWWSHKHVDYATREAVQVLLDNLDAGDSRAAAGRSGRQAWTKRWVKQHVYNRLPMGIGPLLYLCYRLFVRLGILDGPRGIAFHVLQGFWYRLLVDLRRYELGREISTQTTIDAKLTALETLTSLRIRALWNGRPRADGA